ncbi:MAG: trypsin-like peptidase domain-containing protein [Anaerolineales bacterium]|nr:trypsin-like peptidase domain-containing protein [Anaerolineales bacterium]
MSFKARFPALALSGLALAGLACSMLTQPAAGPAPTAAPIVVTQVVVVAATPAPGEAPSQPAVAPALTITSSEEEALVALYERVNPAVVSITVITPEGPAAGSGWLYDAEGHIVTNQHVVEGAASIEVDFASGFKTRAEVVGVDPDADLAVIKVDELPEGVQPLPVGDSDAVKVGQRAVAIGNPFRRAGTMTLGIISGLGRTLDGNRTAPGGGSFSAPDILQTDAPINPGNSGGPLLNLSGEVIGVNRAISTDSGVSSGVGYAIASNTVRQIVPYLIQDGRFIYPYLGISSLPEVTLELQEQLGLTEAKGTYVTNVTAGAPADRAGLRADSSALTAASFAGDGDLIIGVDGREVRVFGDLMSYLVNNTRPGQEITLTVIRAGQQLDLPLTLGERP